MSVHTLSILVENRSGVLARVAGLFARRGFNIDSLAVGETEDPAVSRMTVVISVDGKPLEQATKQLHKLINVLRIAELAPDRVVERELALVKVGVDATTRGEVLQLAAIIGAVPADVGSDFVVLQLAGTAQEVTAAEEMLRSFGIVEMARTGRIALGRDARGLTAPRPEPIDAVNA